MMNLAIKKYLEEVKNSKKLISLKDEVNSIFGNEKEAKSYYSKILVEINKKGIEKTKIFQVIHISQTDFIKIISNLD